MDSMPIIAQTNYVTAANKLSLYLKAMGAPTTPMYPANVPIQGPQIHVGPTNFVVANSPDEFTDQDEYII